MAQNPKNENEIVISTNKKSIFLSLDAGANGAKLQIKEKGFLGNKLFVPSAAYHRWILWIHPKIVMIHNYFLCYYTFKKIST